METHEIRYFLAMVREMNFTRAANACGITQPALTRAIKKLESELGGPLFLRRPGQTELTRLAREVLPQLEAIEQGMSAVRQTATAVTEAQVTSLRIGVMCTVGPTHVVTLLGRLQEALRDVELTIIDAKAADIVKRITADEVDVAIAAWPHYPDEVSAQLLLTERFAVAMRRDHELAQGRTVALDQLEGQRYLDRLGCEFDDYYQALHGEWTIDLDTAFASEREDWITGMLVAGLGCAIVPEYMDLPPDIIKLPLITPEVSREVCVLTLRGKPLPPAAATFVRLARAHKWQPGG